MSTLSPIQNHILTKLKNTPKYDKASHGRLQEKAPGFNYEMLQAEFEKLFTK
jgi:hypothetical protein